MNKILFLLVILLCITGCNKKKKIIPEDDFINILADLSVAEATLERSKYRRFHRYDTVIYQKYIFEKYGYTKSDFDTTLAIYARDIEELREIYEKVTELLQHRSSALRDTQDIDSSRIIRENIWKLQNNWVLPRDGEQETINFNIPTKGPGKYTLHANIKVYPDDESENPRIHIYFYCKDKKNNFGKRRYFKTVSLDKADVFFSHSIVKELKDTSYTHIRGQILGHTNMGNNNWKKHAEVKDISLYYEPLEEVQKE